MRVYRALLHLLPASFRSEYGDEMGAVFARRLRDASGPLAVALAWLEAALDVVGCAARVHLDLLRQDLGHFRRSLGHARGFALTVVIVAALGVGATTAAFSITDHVLIRPLPFPEPDRLVQLWSHQRQVGAMWVELSPANFRDLQRMSSSFTGLGAFNEDSANLLGDGEPKRVESASVTAEVIPLLGTPPLLGRTFTPEEDAEGAPGTVLLSYGLWQADFAGEPGVVGRTLRLDGEPCRVIGVMPRGFYFPRRETRLWRPLRLGQAQLELRDDLWLRSLARLRPGVTLAAARADVDLVAAQLERQYPAANDNVGVSLSLLRDQLSRQSRQLLLALVGAALGVLLIACTNLAGLFLARGLDRRRELAVRSALGAGRDRLLRQLLTESLLLGLLGGLLGVLLAALAIPLLVRLVPNALPIAETPALDLRLLAFAGLLTLATVLGFGLVPALRSLRDRGSAGLREGVRAGSSGRERLRSLLVVAELTVSVVLLVGTGLLVRALLRVQATEPGFVAGGVVTLRTTLPMPAYEPVEKRFAFHRAVLDEVRALPGVESAGYTSFLPLVMGGGIWAVEAEGHVPESGEGRTASVRYVTPGYFDALSIPLRQGRDVSESDTGSTLQAAVVSESFVKRYWPGQNPIGRRFRFGLLGGTTITTLGPFQDRTVVGVVGDVMVRGPERRSEPQLYLPYRQQPENAMGFYTPQDLAVRYAGDPGTLVPALRRIVAAADPALPVANVRTLEAIVEAQSAPRRVQVRVLAAFAALAVLLAGIGIYGLLSVSVASRAQEFGVRRALGARRQDVLRLVLRHGLRLAAAGVGLGLVLAWATGRSLEALLFGVSPRDAATFGAAAVVVLVAGLAGSLPPAWRATRVDPLRVMRAE